MSDSRLTVSAGRIATIQDDRIVVYDRDYVRACLEDAGKTLMALASRGERPQGHRSQMPEPLQDWWLAYAQTAATVRWPRPSATAIDRMDAVLPWLAHVRDERTRRLVALRMLTHPLSERPIWSWRKLANAFGSHHKTVEGWWASGLDDIAAALSRQTRG